MGLHNYVHMSVPQRSNTRNYHVVIMSKIAVGIQHE